MNPRAVEIVSSFEGQYSNGHRPSNVALLCHYFDHFASDSAWTLLERDKRGVQPGGQHRLSGFPGRTRHANFLSVVQMGVRGS